MNLFHSKLNDVEIETVVNETNATIWHKIRKKQAKWNGGILVPISIHNQCIQAQTNLHTHYTLTYTNKIILLMPKPNQTTFRVIYWWAHQIHWFMNMAERFFFLLKMVYDDFEMTRSDKWRKEKGIEYRVIESGIKMKYNKYEKVYNTTQYANVMKYAAEKYMYLYA